MSLGWEVSRQDVETALTVNGVTVSGFDNEEMYDNHVDACIDALDNNAVEREALRGDDMLEQTDLAQCEVEEQLRTHNLC